VDITPPVSNVVAANLARNGELGANIVSQGWMQLPGAQTVLRYRSALNELAKIAAGEKVPQNAIWVHGTRGWSTHSSALLAYEVVRTVLLREASFSSMGLSKNRRGSFSCQCSPSGDIRYLTFSSLSPERQTT
jgi:hypothetical protein